MFSILFNRMLNKGIPNNICTDQPIKSDNEAYQLLDDFWRKYYDNDREHFIVLGLNKNKEVVIIKRLFPVRLKVL